jgi:hypothetical protein
MDAKRHEALRLSAASEAGSRGAARAQRTCSGNAEDAAVERESHEC